MEHYLLIFFFNIYTSGHPTLLNTSVADVAVDKILISINNYHETASSNLQLNHNDIHKGFQKWRVNLTKINQLI